MAEAESVGGTVVIAACSESVLSQLKSSVSRSRLFPSVHFAVQHCLKSITPSTNMEVFGPNSPQS